MMNENRHTQPLLTGDNAAVSPQRITESFEPATNGNPNGSRVGAPIEAPQAQISPSNPPMPSDEPEIQLPPLISYCSYVRYGCAFGKWIILVAIINFVALVVPLSHDYFNYDGIIPVDSVVMGGLLAATWLGTSVWLFWAAKVVERQVQRADLESDYERAGSSLDLTESGPGNTGTTATAASAPTNNYEYIHGEVSRKIDASFSGAERPAVSSLVNISFALWALFAGAGTFMATGTALGTHYSERCSRAQNRTEGAKTSGDISTFPSDVQKWITDRDEAWLDRNDILFMNDDFYGGRSQYGPSYGFPVVNKDTLLTFGVLTDGTILFSGQVPRPFTGSNADPDEDEVVEKRDMVLIESQPDGTVKYHEDIVSPKMFIPVEMTIQEQPDGSIAAGIVCFTSAPEKKKQNREPWRIPARPTQIRCASVVEGEVQIRNTAVGWSERSMERQSKLTAASTGDLILLDHWGMNDESEGLIQEVISLNPITMNSKKVFQLEMDQNDFYDRGYGGRNRWRKKRQRARCIRNHVSVWSTIACMLVWFGASFWLIVREGIPSGVVPAICGLVAIFAEAFGYRYYRLPVALLVVGTIFLHIIVCFISSSGAPSRFAFLPPWIGRELCIWALYGYIIAFAVMDGMLLMVNDVLTTSLILLGLTGLVLDHPVVKCMGWCAVGISAIMFCVAPFGYDTMDGILVAMMALLMGIGMIGFSNVVTNNRKYAAAICRPCSRAYHAAMYGSTPVSTV